jgi:hypothetical protein
MRFILWPAEKYSDGESGPEFYTTIFLSNKTFFKRIWIAIKYIFGYKCKYGHFDEFVWREDDMAQLADLAMNYHGMCRAFRKGDIYE